MTSVVGGAWTVLAAVRSRQQADLLLFEMFARLDKPRAGAQNSGMPSSIEVVK
jgi:hypothetical protein